MIAFLTILITVGLGWSVLTVWEDFNERQEAKNRLPFWPWCFRGWVAPVLVVTLFNTGWPGRWPPLLGGLTTVTGAGWPSWEAFWETECLAVASIGVGWAMVGFSWLLGFVMREAPRSLEWPRMFALWGILALPVVGAAGLFFGIAGAALALVGCGYLLTKGALDALPRRRPAPAYSKAIAKLKMGKLEEAEWAVIAQLEQFENDFQGWMLLAEVYAEHYGDMAAAEQTVLELCAQDHINGSEMAVALHRLADWYLRLADDPAGARFALEEIVRRLPGTHLEKMARQRIDRLPATREAWEEEKRGRTYAVPKKPRLPSN